MARTTGYPCTAMARLIIDGKFKKKGICPPEFVSESDECFDFIMEFLARKDIHYNKRDM